MDAKEYMQLHILWSKDFETDPEEIVIDESVFEEIYRLQEREEKKNVQGTDRTRWI